MSRDLRKVLAVLLVLQLVIPCSALAAAIGEFTSVTGKVTQTRAQTIITPVEKTPIQIKDIVSTARAASAAMTFTDSSTIQVGENTRLEINQFLFKKKSRTAVFLLTLGRLTADVSKFLGNDNVFEVRSPTCVVGVRGTGFDIIEEKEADQTKATVSCSEGSLNLSALSDTGQVVSTAVLKAGQMAVISGGLITVSLISAAAATGGGGAAAAAGGGGTATAAATGTGLSTGAIVGATAAVVAAGGAAVAVSDNGSSGGGDDDKKSDPATPYDATGTWKWTDTYEENNCGEPVAPYDSGIIEIVQTGTTITGIDEEGKSFSGTVNGTTYTFTTVYQEDSGTTTDENIVILNSATEGTYTINWTWTDGTHSCSGITQGTMVKIK